MPSATTLNISNHFWPLFALCLGVLVGFGIFYGRFTRREASDLIKRWAGAHQFTILKAKQRTIAPLWRGRRGYQYWRLETKDESGIVRKCWLCFPDCSLDPIQIEIVWDDKTVETSV